MLVSGRNWRSEPKATPGTRRSSMPAASVASAAADSPGFPVVLMVAFLLSAAATGDHIPLNPNVSRPTAMPEHRSGPAIKVIEIGIKDAL
jgi:hypothetical protein